MRALLFFLVPLFFATPFASAQQVPQFQDTVRCRENLSQKYALYVPSTDDTSRAWPVILFLDAGGRGALPVRKYQSLADRYQIILAGSYNSRNGPFELSQRAAEAIVRDLKSHFQTDSSKFFISGFSGGARAAAQLCLVSADFSGIIACGAFNNELGNSRYTGAIAGIVGRGDLNYLEGIDVHKSMESHGRTALLSFFDGGHDWPPVAAFETGLLWTLSARNPSLSPIRDSLAAEVWDQLLESTTSSIWIEHDLTAKQLVRISPTYQPRVDSLLSVVGKDPTNKKSRYNAQKLLAKEKVWQQSFVSEYKEQLAYGAPDSLFKPRNWTSMANDIATWRNAAQPDQKWLADRLESFAVVAAVEGYYNFMRYQQHRQAAAAGKILTLLQPKAIHHFLLTARAYASMNDRPNTIRYLKEAFQKGMQASAIRNDALLSPFLADKKLKEWDGS